MYKSTPNAHAHTKTCIHPYIHQGPYLIVVHTYTCIYVYNISHRYGYRHTHANTHKHTHAHSKFTLASMVEDPPPTHRAMSMKKNEAKPT